jgi:hypothetical protein
MNKIKEIINIILIVLMAYFITAFVLFEFDVSKWSDIERSTVVVFSIFCIIIKNIVKRH